MASPRARTGPGPFRAHQIREGDRYELSEGHAIFCAPSGRRGGRANLVGGEALDTDPCVETAGVDIGFSQNPGHLRAPDISVGSFDNEPGWAPGAPPLAVEYADTGQDEAELQAKIGELLAGGSRHVWVVRLVGPRRVEVHEPGGPMRIAVPGEELHAPGILKNAVPVLALFDRDAAHEVALRNLLQRRGYRDLDAVRAEGEAKGRAEGEAKGRAGALLALLDARGLRVTPAEQRKILSMLDLARLDDWIKRAATAASTRAVLQPVAARRTRTR